MCTALPICSTHKIKTNGCFPPQQVHKNLVSKTTFYIHCNSSGLYNLSLCIQIIPGNIVRVDEWIRSSWYRHGCSHSWRSWNYYAQKKCKKHIQNVPCNTKRNWVGSDEVDTHPQHKDTHPNKQLLLLVMFLKIYAGQIKHMEQFLPGHDDWPWHWTLH